ncbi:hypothetical protein QNA08_10115 [Chelatococcus sp. SYSU_G07232]|uniref:Uncharacterized protein n=1 Tax=Chelatococcus albus TaxID=3047466 RepID=A0ABT7AIG9_9HYPH|nr:hypothetical protein [Chelatococcus sp. SYSU_G07232]MDJ1158589.1 hypothetical protein [Chelatococcus sp. SYSU_G07232]
MRTAILSAVCAAVLVALPPVAWAQVPGETTRSERQINELNRSMSRQQQNLQQNQQFQFEIDQLRQQQQRNQQFPPSIRSSPTCPPGSIGC